MPNLVLADAARSRADDVDAAVGGDDLTARRCARRPEDNLCAGRRHHVLVAHPQDGDLALRRSSNGSPHRRHRDREDESRRVREQGPSTENSGATHNLRDTARVPGG
jgi:hypothetical protein